MARSDSERTRSVSCRVELDVREEAGLVVVGGRHPRASVDAVDDIVYRRPSRYAESDELGPTAWAESSKFDGKPLLDAVRSWVDTQLYYVSESSRPTDAATQTLLLRQGVCRGWAQLVIAMLRARNVPGRGW